MQAELNGTAGVNRISSALESSPAPRGKSKGKSKAKSEAKASESKAKAKSRWATWKANHRLAASVGAISTFVLALSLWECATALHSLTGMPLPLAGMLAVGIDAGLVGAELTEVNPTSGPEAKRWAWWYVLGAVGLSVVLNAFAASLHSEGMLRLVGAGVGACVPLLVLGGFRIAGNLWNGK